MVTLEEIVEELEEIPKYYADDDETLSVPALEAESVSSDNQNKSVTLFAKNGEYIVNDRQGVITREESASTAFDVLLNETPSYEWSKIVGNVDLDATIDFGGRDWIDMRGAKILAPSNQTAFRCTGSLALNSRLVGGRVEGGQVGLWLDNTRDLLVRDLWVTDASEAGLKIRSDDGGSWYNEFDNLRLNNNGVGIDAQETSDNINNFKFTGGQVRLNNNSGFILDVGNDWAFNNITFESNGSPHEFKGGICDFSSCRFEGQNINQTGGYINRFGGRWVESVIDNGGEYNYVDSKGNAVFDSVSAYDFGFSALDYGARYAVSDDGNKNDGDSIKVTVDLSAGTNRPLSVLSLKAISTTTGSNSYANDRSSVLIIDIVTKTESSSIKQSDSNTDISHNVSYSFNAVSESVYEITINMDGNNYAVSASVLETNYDTSSIDISVV